MEVKIGVQHISREIVLESNQSPEDVESALSAALDKGTVLSLADERGRRILIPADRIAYVEIGAGQERKVGFGA
ncbi:DUF3107 domain-containing protein [Tenggerimyces flavus]|uniref:DUF3107 domain-containing protein n=1 Tax=Tenggerimyces flavus TaxID=1708749 RepID=A0ABV7YGK3_9ACTN|nr:DUF3107 domain-containing protein [Tenggerimyces flavus]MBM7786061.1 polysaccharide deacetylase 2 family uncharacterized protein YibQ [Tenggerimyces flavus]